MKDYVFIFSNSGNFLKTLMTYSNIPVDTGCKLNVHKTFRRRSGRLLYVLCTFNLRPVSTGMNDYSSWMEIKAIL